MKLILIDDDAIQNHLVKMTIKKTQKNIDYNYFSNPEFALEYLSLISENENPTLILLDLNMPELSGWQFLDKYSLLSITTKVAILSSTIDEADFEKSKNYPIVFHFCHKPLTAEKLIEMIEKVEAESSI